MTAVAVPSPTELLARHGSPLFVYDAGVVRRDHAAFRAAFPYAPLACHYAIVCNKNPYLLRVLHAEGAGVHANTPGDLFAARAAGVPASAIVYSGSNLDAADLDAVLAAGAALNVDALDQLRDLCARAPVPVEVGLRVLVDAETRTSRIGLAPSEIPEAVALAAEAGIAVRGLHMYAGTNTLRAPRFLECLDRLVLLSAALPDLAWLDLGGGFGVAYRDGQSPLDLPALGAAVAERLRALSARRGRAIGLVLEPGRSLVARSGTLYTRVLTVKERGGRRYVGADATVANMAAESVYHPWHRVEAIDASGPVLDVPTEVCGNTTHSRDFLARDCRLPVVRPGDVLALRDVGAYAYAMSSHFLNRPRPAEVVIDGGVAHLTTRRETLQDLLALQVGPSA